MNHQKSIHLISFDVPFPADYGGIIDVFYRIKAFHDAGINVHLHCWEYGRGKPCELENLCESVTYYPRNKSALSLFSSVPYIIYSRNNKSLLTNLLKDNYPIFFEGLHATFFLDAPELKNRKKVVRMHNVEHDYYEGLEKVERNLIRKFYFKLEANKLRKFEKILHHANIIVAVSRNDENYLKALYDNVIYVPSFHPNQIVISKPGIGKYALYHGNLSVAENNNAAMYLVNDVFNDLDYPLIISGKNPTEELIQGIKKHPNIKLIQNPDEATNDDLILNAHITILPTFQPTGLKLKLLNSLFMSRWCIANTEMTINTSLQNLCIIKDSAACMKEAILAISSTPFDEQVIKERQEILSREYNNFKNGETLIGALFN